MKQLAVEDSEQSTAVRRLCSMADLQGTGLHHGLPWKLQVHQFGFNHIGDWCLNGRTAIATFCSAAETHHWTVS